MVELPQILRKSLVCHFQAYCGKFTSLSFTKLKFHKRLVYVHGGGLVVRWC